ncbi:hypothetical protein QBC34DRAFT_471937 [Podospora aff. communis PSN243]|uniref:Receptor L-domain domain-containing protein n=1 Tax=Podospora aff. communis PSN243 TaxID=3040156 RepID=A0AAV9GCU9_9PEZI|nr:hypothetical protein QBC34DRAFT_471937 [Podospora aff. communis PSN243]
MRFLFAATVVAVSLAPLCSQAQTTLVHEPWTGSRSPKEKDILPCFPGQEFSIDCKEKLKYALSCATIDLNTEKVHLIATLSITNMSDPIDLGHIQQLQGELIISDSGPNGPTADENMHVVFHHLESANAIRLAGNSFQAISFPQLTGVADTLSVDDHDILAELSVPNLHQIGTLLRIMNNPSLLYFAAEELTHADNIDMESLNLADVRFQTLSEIAGDFTLWGGDSMDCSIFDDTLQGKIVKGKYRCEGNHTRPASAVLRQHPATAETGEITITTGVTTITMGVTTTATIAALTGNATATSTASAPTHPGSGDGSRSVHTSTGTKLALGLGFGIGLGVLFGAILACVWWRRKKHLKLMEEKNKEATAAAVAAAVAAARPVDSDDEGDPDDWVPMNGPMPGEQTTTTTTTTIQGSGTMERGPSVGRWDNSRWDNSRWVQEGPEHRPVMTGALPSGKLSPSPSQIGVAR